MLSYMSIAIVNGTLREFGTSVILITIIPSCDITVSHTHETRLAFF